MPVEGKAIYLGDNLITLIKDNGFVQVDPLFVEGYDPDAQAFFTATGITDETQKNAVNGLVEDLKTAGIWSKIEALYPLVGGDATKHSYNLKDTTQYQITFGGGVTHNVSGSQGNGSTGYADTGLDASTINSSAPEDGCHMLMYIQAMVAEGGLDMGITDGTTSWHMNSRNPSNVWNTRNISGTLDGATLTATTSGVFAQTRTSSTSYFKSNNKNHQVISRTAGTMPSRNVAFMCQRGNVGWGDFQTRMFSLVSIGGALTQAEVDDFVDINQTYQTALGRFA